MSLIRLENIYKKYQTPAGDNIVLNNISLTINSGEMLAIVGPSGSGKSTLMHVLGLLDGINNGIYYFQGREVASLVPNELAMIRNREFGFVFQQFHLLPRLNVLENIALPLHYRGIDPKEIKTQVLEVLELVNMGTYLHYLPSQLSGGQQQRVAIARAIVGEPRVIFADEPTGALDSVTGQGIMQLFLNFNISGRTVVLVTHDAKIASQCRRQIILQDGYILH